MRVNYGGMQFGAEELNAIIKSVTKNYWPLAEEGEKMELEAANYLGVKYGVLANSGSSAGLLALISLELMECSEVIIPATTFPTIFNIIPQCGLVPVVVDTVPGTYNINLDDVEKELERPDHNIKAIIAVHAVGNPVDMPRLMKIAKKHKIYVIEDNCDGWGSSIGKTKVGAFGDISFTSFHAAHIVSMGQGGGVFTNNKELARAVRMYRDWGRQSDSTSRTNEKWQTLPKDYDGRFIYEKLGFNLSPLELQAAMGRVQLKKTEKIKKLRKANFDYLYKNLSPLKSEGLILPTWNKDADVCWFSFPLAYKNRGALVKHLEANDIETRSMFAGNILKHPGYQYVGHRQVGDLKGANEILKTAFWVSVHPSLTEEQRKYLVKTFYGFFA